MSLSLIFSLIVIIYSIHCRDASFRGTGLRVCERIDMSLDERFPNPQVFVGEHTLVFGQPPLKLVFVLCQ